MPSEGPVQIMVTPVVSPQEQHSNSRITSRSNMNEDPQNEWMLFVRQGGSEPDWSAQDAGRVDAALRAFSFGAVFGTGLFAVRHALRVENAAHNVVADAGQVTDAAA